MIVRTPLVILAVTQVLAGGCCFYCERGVPFVICPVETAIVGESIEVMVTGNFGSELTIEWSIDGDAVLVDETSETAVVTPTGPGTIIVTVTATEESSGALASGMCAFEAVEEPEES